MINVGEYLQWQEAFLIKKKGGEDQKQYTLPICLVTLLRNVPFTVDLERPPYSLITLSTKTAILMGRKQLTIASFSKLNFSLLNTKERVMLAFAILNTIGCGISLPLFVLCFAKATSLYENSEMEQKDILYKMGLNTVYLGVGALVSGTAMMLLWFHIGVKADQRIRRLYLTYLLHVGHQQINIDPFKVKNDCIEIESGLGKKVGFFMFGLTMYVASEIIILTVNWKLGLVNIYVLASLIVVGFCWFCSNQPSIAMKKDKFECSSLYAEEALRNIYSVMTLANFAYEYWKYETRLRVSRKRGIRYGKLYAINLFVFLFLVLNSFSLTVWYAGKQVLESRETTTDQINELKVEERVKEGNVLVVIVAILFLHVSIGSVTNNAKHILISCVNGSRFFKYKAAIDLYDRAEEKKGNCCLADLNTPNAIEIHHLSPLDISLTIPNKTKTTILIDESNEVDIANHFIEAINLFSQEKAQITFYGNPISLYKPPAVRRLIAYVNGKCNLLNETIYENLTIACEKINTKRYQEAIDIAHVSEILNDYGLDYLVGPRGEYLSLYCRFRVSIARAIMTEAKIFVIDYKGFEHRSLIYDIDARLTHYAMENSITYVAFNLKPKSNAATKHNVITIDKDRAGASSQRMNHMDLHQCLSISLENEAEALMVKGVKSVTYNEKLSTSSDLVLEKAVKHFPSHIELGARIMSKKDVITRYPKHIALAVILIAINGTISPLNGRIIGYTLMALSEPSNQQIKNLTELYSMIFLVFASVSSAAQSVESYLYNYLGESLKTNVRLLQYERYLNVDFNYFKDTKHPTHKLISKLNFQSKNISGVAVYLFFTASQKGISFVVGFIISMHSDWRVCLLQCCLLPLIFLFLYYNWRVNRINKPIGVKYEMDYGGIVDECYYNRKLINSLGIQKKILERFSLLKRYINPPRFWSNRVYSYSFGFSLFAMLGADGIMLIAASFLMEAHQLEFNQIIKSSYSMLISIFGLVIVQGYICALAISWNVSQGQMAVINDPTPPQGISEFFKMKGMPIQGCIKFNSVCFGFNQEHKLFDGLSLSFMPNTCSAIHGKGKTTLFNLLMRINCIQSGSITIDGVDIRQMNICDLRHSIAFFHEGLNYLYLKRNYCFHNVTGQPLSDNEMITLMMSNASFVLIDDEALIRRILNGHIDFTTLLKNKVVIVTTDK